MTSGYDFHIIQYWQRILLSMFSLNKSFRAF